MSQAILKFLAAFPVKINYIRTGQHFYSFSEEFNQFRESIKKVAWYRGERIGTGKKGTFRPSPRLLELAGRLDGVPYLSLNTKGSWLYLCGRDVMVQSITGKSGDTSLGNLVLIKNEYGETIGYARIFGNSQKDKRMIARNLFDLGNYLRRER
jgi:ribosome biogenesis protein Nip4